MAAPLEYSFISLSTKPTAQLCYRFVPATRPPTSTSKPSLLVFLNGLGLPQDFWAPTIAELQALRPDSLPAILTYDRFGQGRTTDRDPQDAGAADPTHAHDCMSAVRDLRQLVTQIAREKLRGFDNADEVPLVLACNSIGCALARLYAHEHPGTVAGLLFLDSVLANSDFVSQFPDPDAEGFTEEGLPEGVTAEVLRTARERIGAMFHPDVGNKEGLSRKNLRVLLPDADAPVLKGADGKGPYVTVLGHEFEHFGVEAEKMGMPRAATLAYSNPYWDRYNRGLARITESSRSKGPVQVPGAGHFIQRDNPAFVAAELDAMLGKLE
ncbi:alpha/beta-Hydrolase [Purpureocillium lilacinum]|uniref:Alpha/beta-Hydrolase n=1 Tax=Purpureocillium lilacinum TaxID=33203 RepID=A0A179GDI3_PURLI|nr:alpha/beta-Hydrolase [Purpureocillium lilacinum]OAQ75885.1 alpha/beta-Hydrolase [Purpureocillium lilacinum]